MAWNIGLDFIEHCNGGTDLAGRAVATLEPVVFDKGGLHRMEVLRLPQAFERGDAVALVHDGERQASVDAAAFNENRARSALTVVAPLLGTRQMQMLAQRVEKRRSVIELKLPAFVVHRECDLRALGCGGGIGLRVTERMCAHHCHGSGRGGEQVAPRDFKCARTLHIQLHVLMTKGLKRVASIGFIRRALGLVVHAVVAKTAAHLWRHALGPSGREPRTRNNQAREMIRQARSQVS